MNTMGVLATEHVQSALSFFMLIFMKYRIFTSIELSLPGAHAIPINLQRLALVLDSILTQCSSEQAPEVATLREKLSSGSTADFRNLDPLELSNLASYLAILATELARKAPEPAAHEDMIPDAPEDGSL